MQDSGGCHCQFGPHVPGIRNPEVRIFPKSLPPRIAATKQLFPQVGDSCIIISFHDLLKHDKAFCSRRGMFPCSSWKYCNLEVICVNHNIWASLHGCCLPCITLPILPILCICICCMVCVSSEDCSLQSYCCNTS